MFYKSYFRGESVASHCQHKPTRDGCRLQFQGSDALVGYSPSRSAPVVIRGHCGSSKRCPSEYFKSAPRWPRQAITQSCSGVSVMLRVLRLMRPTTYFSSYPPLALTRSADRLTSRDMNAWLGFRALYFWEVKIHFFLHTQILYQAKGLCEKVINRVWITRKKPRGSGLSAIERFTSVWNPLAPLLYHITSRQCRLHDLHWNLWRRSKR